MSEKTRSGSRAKPSVSEQLHAALRRLEYVQGHGSTPTCQGCGYASPVHWEGELIAGGHANGCWVAAALTAFDTEPGRATPASSSDGLGVSDA